MQFLGNSLWQFIINVAIGLIAISISIIIYRKQQNQNQKSITYEVLSDTTMLSSKDTYQASLHKEVKGRVQILFDAKPIDNARLVLIRIWNSGKVPIQSEDYDKNNPIKFDFGDQAEILDADILETVPSNIKETAKSCLNLDQGSLILQPLLLNRGDSLTFKVLLAQTHDTKQVNITARIVGINKIFKFNRRTFYSGFFARTVIYSSFLIFLASVVYFILSMYEHSFIMKISLLGVIILSALIYVCLFVILVSLFYSWTYKLSLFQSFKNTFRPLRDLIKSLFQY